jgi:uncharacterized protein with beta-barrel porin domain
MSRFYAARKFVGAIMLVALPMSAHAASFTIHNGENAGQQWLTDDTDKGTIEQGGTVSTSGDFTPGVNAVGAYNTVTNYGVVNTNGQSSFGINSTNTNVTVVNGTSGMITGSGTYWTGIYSYGAYANIDNRGLISGSGIYSEGIYSDGDYAVVRNSGSIVTSDTSGSATAGIYSDGYGAILINTGTIDGNSNGGSIGIYSAASNATITNKGAINATGDSAYGIYSYDSDNVTIVNRGTIIASGTDYSEGILHWIGDNATLINSSKIIATASAGDAYAIDMYGANDIVTLLAHTAVQGGIYFEQPDSATLNIGTGLNTALTFYTASKIPMALNTSGQPYVIDGALLAVVDPTGLAAANSFGFDLTRSIGDAVEAHLGAPGADAMTTGALPGQSSAAQRGYWAAGLGFYDQYAGQGSLDGYHDGAAGMIAGLDRWLSASTSAGVFGGVSAGVIQTAAASTNIDAVGAFAGGFWNHDDGKAFARVSLAGGGLDNNSDRTVANNLVDGGLETASAEYGSFYVSPALTLGLHHDMGGAIVSPSVGLRYAGIYRGGYSETGSAANVTAGSSTAQALDVRGELRTDFAAKVTDAGVRRFNVRAGVDGIFTSGGATDGSLLGTDITLLAGGQTSAARGYLGGGLTFSQANGTHLNTDVQASYDTANTFALSAQAGLSGGF